ncbi:MAG: hypothetical protein ABIF04_02860 [Chloroflexota bacterium]
MKHFWTLILTLAILQSACASSSGQALSTETSGFLAPQCGNHTCEVNESAVSCPQDCPATTFSGRVETTHIKSEDTDIAVMVASPRTQRYPEGAGVVLVVPPIFTETSSFITDPDLTSLGLIQVSYLWPGETDSATGVRSAGKFDYGGEQSIKVLRDVIRFAAGRMADSNGRYIVSMTSVSPLTDELGLYAFADAGIAVVNALSLYGDQFQGLQYYVGNENPTVDTISSLEIGYYDETGQPVYNPFYLYPSSYSPTELTLNYASLRWDSTYTDSQTQMVGRPYLDLDGSENISAGDFIFSAQAPVMFGERYYSAALTQALLNNDALSTGTWPADLATPQEAAQAWSIRQSPDRFAEMQNSNIVQDLKVMLVFARSDHAQVAVDKPHIHQDYQGFRFEARLWVRLNPDLAYAQSLIPKAGLGYPDNPADTQPTDWTQIGEYAYPGQGQAGGLVLLAAVSEMADRAHFGRWDENLGQTLYTYSVSTPQP